MSIRVLLADDHEIVRHGLKALLVQRGFNVVADVSDGLEAVESARTLRPDVAVLDYSMPAMNGLNAARRIMQVSPETKTLLLTMHAEDRLVLESLRAGISGYLLKSRAALELYEAINEIQRGNTYLSPAISGTVVKAYVAGMETPENALSPREQAVLQLIAEGKTTKEVAVILGIAVKTAESHRTNIMTRLGIHDTAGLVRHAIRTGLIQP